MSVPNSEGKKAWIVGEDSARRRRGIWRRMAERPRAEMAVS